MLAKSPIPRKPNPGQLRTGAHSDYGSLTLLFQEDVEGLEVLNTQGEWITAPTIPGTIVINTGDLLQCWSNDLFCLTKHRVTLSSGENSQQHRYSIALSPWPSIKPIPHELEKVSVNMR